MNIFEGYKKAVEIYNKNSGTEDGRKTVTWYNNKLGVSKEYLVWFTTCVICYGIPLYAVLHTYRDWKRYVVSYYKKTSQPIPNIESLNYQQTMKIINECKRQWAKPNPIYNQNGVYVGEFKSFSDANMLPINTNWCITKTKSRYNEFNNENSKCLYIINNSNQDPWRRVIAVVYTDRVEYWDSTNIRIDDNAPYEKTLPIEAVNIIHSRYQNNTNENKQYKTRYNMKKTIRLTESDLHRIIKECVNHVLMESTDISDIETNDELDEGFGNWIRAGVDALSNTGAYTQGQSNSKLCNFVDNVRGRKQNYDDIDTMQKARENGYQNAPQAQMAKARNMTYTAPGSNRQVSDTRRSQAYQTMRNAKETQQRVDRRRSTRDYDQRNGTNHYQERYGH